MQSNLAYATPALSTPVSPVAVRLRDVRDAVEHRFLKAGDVLAEAAEGLGQLIAGLDRLVEALGGAGGAEATARLADAAAALIALPETHGERLSLIGELQRSGDGLAANVAEMKQDLTYLWTFASNIKITAAGIASGNADLADFAQEIYQRIEYGRTRLKAFEAELGGLFDLFVEAQAQERALASRCDALFPALPNSLSRNARTLEEHHKSLAVVATKIAGLGRSVQAQLGAALGGLQVGDSARQRIEHVLETLELVDAQEGLDPDQRGRMRAFVSHLAAEQLDATSAEFHQEIGRLGLAMSGLARDAGSAFDVRDLALGRDQGDGGVLRRLETDIAGALALVDEMAGVSRQAARLGGSAADATAQLCVGLGELQHIKTDVQYMAVNTVLKSARLGDAGKPLSVIAVELRRHANLIETSARSALGMLDEVSSRAGRLTDGREDAIDPADQARMMLEGVRANLHATAEGVERDLGGLAQQGGEVAGKLRHACASLDLKTEIGRGIDEAAGLLRQDADPDPSRLAGIEAPLADLLARAARRYTMASERRVHAEIVATLPFDVAEARPAAATEVVEEESVLF